MPGGEEIFRPTERDLDHFLRQPFVRYMLVKSRKLPPAEVLTILAELRKAYWAHLRSLPVVRLWPDQWLAEEWRRYARL